MLQNLKGFYKISLKFQATNPFISILSNVLLWSNFFFYHLLKIIYFLDKNYMKTFSKFLNENHIPKDKVKWSKCKFFTRKKKTKRFATGLLMECFNSWWLWEECLVALRGIHCVKEFCTPFNSKTCKYSQPSFEMELLRNCVLINKNVIQWNVINYMKEFIVLYCNNKY